MNSENKILKIVWDKGSKVHMQAIAREAGFGIDYTRYILRELLKDTLIAPVAGKDMFKATSKGGRRLWLSTGEKRAAHRKYSVVKRKKPVIIRQAVNSQEQPKVALTHNLDGNNKEKKVNIWGAIKKAASYLSELPQEGGSRDRNK